MNDTTKEALATVRRVLALVEDDDAGQRTEGERALATLEKALEAAAADYAALVEAGHKACSMCHGKRTYETPCPYCDDSTCDHECVHEVMECNAEIHKRLDQLHPGAPLLARLQPEPLAKWLSRYLFLGDEP